MRTSIEKLAGLESRKFLRKKAFQDKKLKLQKTFKSRVIKVPSDAFRNRRARQKYSKGNIR